MFKSLTSTISADFNQLFLADIHLTKKAQELFKKHRELFKKHRELFKKHRELFKKQRELFKKHRSCLAVMWRIV